MTDTGEHFLNRDTLRDKMDRYHNAIARGRHPVSFSRSTHPIWQFVCVPPHTLG